MANPPKIFVSYSHKDKDWLVRLQEQFAPLARGTLLVAWNDTQIAPGTKWREEIARAIDEADISVLLVSPGFLASDFIAQHELKPLLAKERVFWIAVKHSNYARTDIGQYQCANDPARPLASLKGDTRNKAWVDICNKILAASANPCPGGLFHVPYPINPYFTGRKQVLADLGAALATGKPTALTQAIAGLGGVGKTQTAVEYAYRHRNDYRAVLWARADSDSSLISDFLTLAALLNLPEKDARDPIEVREAVKRWLSRNEDYLLVLDNANEPDLLKPFLPLDPRGHILITTRAHNLDVLNIDAPIDLEVMSANEALKFLLKRAKRQDTDPAKRTAAEGLARELGYLPLALEQAAAYMVVQQEPFAVYLDAYRAERLKLLDEMGPVVGEYPETVRTTWKRSFDAVAAASPASSALLSLSAFFAPDAIPYDLILEGASELGEPFAPALTSPPGGDHALNKLLTPLARHSLVHRDPEARTYSVHRLVQAVLLDELTVHARRDFAERAIKVLNRTFPTDVEYPNWPQCERLLPHTLAAQVRIESEGLRVPEAAQLAQLLARAGYYLYHRIRYAEAKPLILRALNIRQVTLGPDHPDTAFSFNDLGVLSRVQGDLNKEAEPLLRRALAIREKTLVPDHPDTAISLNNLAILLRDQGHLKEAEPLFLRALEIREETLGPNHRYTAHTLNDLAILLQVKGHLEEAEPLFRRALEIREKTLGLNNPDTAYSLDKLAVLLDDQGRYEEAEPLHRRALAIREKTVGPDHPDTAPSLNNLALLLRAQGRPAEAEPLFRRALAIREAALGPDHPDTAQSLNNLALLLRAQGRPAEAEPLFRRALAIDEQALGPDHPHTVTCRENLATLLSG